MWFVGKVGNYVARLDPRTGAFKRYAIDAGTHPHNLVVDGTGMVWFTGNANGRIVKMDPATGALTTFLMPDSSVRDPRTMIAVWYGDYTRGFLGRLDPRTGATEEYALPSGAASLPYAMTLDDRGRIWLAETGIQPNRLVAFDPAKKSFTEAIPIPADGPNAIRHMVFDAKSPQIWFGGDANMIGRVNVSPAPLVPWASLDTVRRWLPRQRQG